MKKKKIKMFDKEVMVGKFISGPIEMEVEIYYDEIKKIDSTTSELRMSGIFDSMVNKSNPLKPKKKNKNYVSRINCDIVFEMKEGGVYRNGKLIDADIEIKARIIKPGDIN